LAANSDARTLYQSSSGQCLPMVSSTNTDEAKYVSVAKIRKQSFCCCDT